MSRELSWHHWCLSLVGRNVYLQMNLKSLRLAETNGEEHLKSFRKIPLFPELTCKFIVFFFFPKLNYLSSLISPWVRAETNQASSNAQMGKVIISLPLLLIPSITRCSEDPRWLLKPAVEQENPRDWASQPSLTFASKGLPWSKWIQLPNPYPFCCFWEILPRKEMVGPVFRGQKHLPKSECSDVLCGDVNPVNSGEQSN